MFNDNMICNTNNININSSPEILSALYEGGVVNNNVTMYVNGISENISVSTQSGSISFIDNASPDSSYSPLTFNPAMYIGSIGGPGNETWKGLISEIIVFDRILKNEERKSIEKYLGKKYNIKISE